PLTVLTVSPPPLVRGADPALAREPRELERLARVHGVTLEHRVETGNPIVRIREAAADHDLVVIGVHRRRPSPFDPDVSVHLLHDLPASLLLVPRAEP
ncbi:MAG TPA: universal stress protein, partial [Myxococcota bacterium]|nr:universal stress protein [Myxococcota bacterium]